MTAESLPKSSNHTPEGKFAPGNCANPGGRPKGTNKALEDIEKAIKDFEIENKTPYWTAATLIAMKLAYKGNTTLLQKILDKFVSSKIMHEADENTGLIVMMPAVKIDGKTMETKIGT